MIKCDYTRVGRPLTDAAPGPQHISHRRLGAQLLVGGEEAAPDAAGGQPGHPAPRGRARASGCSTGLVADRHADRRRAAAPGLRHAADAARRRTPSRRSGSSSRSVAGRVVIGANEAAVHTLLPLHRTVRDATIPQALVDVRRVPSRQMATELLNRSLDCGVLTFQPPDKGLQSISLGRDELVLLDAPAASARGRRRRLARGGRAPDRHRAQRSVAGARARPAALRAAARADQHPDRAAEPGRHQARGGIRARRRGAAAPLRAGGNRARPARGRQRARASDRRGRSGSSIAAAASCRTPRRRFSKR